MEIIDIHAHVYPKIAGATNSAPITGEPLGRARVGNERRQMLPPSFEATHSTPEMLVAYMDWCGIDKSILMPNPLYGYFNDYFIESATKFPTRLKAVALVDLIRGKRAAEELAHLYDTTCLFGFKVETDSSFQFAPDKHLADEDLLPVWDCCNQYHQPVFLHLFTDRDVADLKKLIALFPHITFVLCHLGADACFAPGRSAGNFDELVSLLRDHANVYMDTSTVPVYFPEEYPFPSSVERILRAYKAAGPEKLMWASDYPGMLCHATMPQLIDLVRTQCPISPEHLEMILGGNARRLFFS